MKLNLLKPMFIQSAAFSDVFLRMDGSNVTQKTGSGGGVVNCQKGMEETGKFKIQQQNDGTVVIESIKYPGVYLRMDGSNVKSFAGAGAGRVNCQLGADMWEHFKLHEQEDGSYTIESAAFKNVFLRMDGNNASSNPSGFGVVNCQFGAQSCERFYLVSDSNDLLEKGKDFLNKCAKK